MLHKLRELPCAQLISALKAIQTATVPELQFHGWFLTFVYLDIGFEQFEQWFSGCKSNWLHKIHLLVNSTPSCTFFPSPPTLFSRPFPTSAKKRAAPVRRPQSNGRTDARARLLQLRLLTPPSLLLLLLFPPLSQPFKKGVPVIYWSI